MHAHKHTHTHTLIIILSWITDREEEYVTEETGG